MQRLVSPILGLCLAMAAMPFLLSCQGTGKSSNPTSPQPTDSTTSSPVAAAPAAQLSDTPLPVPMPTGGLKIAYVYMDTILQGYDYYFQLEREMKNLTDKAEKELEQKGVAIQQRMATLQDKAQRGLMTRSEAQKEQEDLAQEQTRYMQLQETHRQQLMEEEQVRTRKVMAAIQDYIAVYNRTAGYDYILSVGILYGAPQLNITQEILKGLNAEYAAQHKAQAAK